MTVLVTGGAGYIGSHALLRLLREGERVVTIDNLLRGHRRPIELLQERFPGKLTFVEGDIADEGLVSGVMAAHGVTTVMHFAALTYVGESVEKPLWYWTGNAAASLALLRVCDRSGVERFIFSSTAATYGQPGAEHVPIVETTPQHPINPYGASKLAFEQMLWDWCRQRASSGRPVGAAALRYFNVAGCDRGGLLGEDHDPETHLIPVILQAALGLRERIDIFGEDYPTPDGTCIRDYLHVEDLVDAHVRVMRALQPGETRRYNLAIGRGYSVREVIEACRAVTGREFAVRAGARRAGDPPVLYADPSLIANELGWRAEVTDLHAIVESAWRWFLEHPRGYGDSPARA
ncbi:MAG: UDP-glucose 4-epimerase GalE [Phycisphaeraceae bacterium]|nr:UDP-glucose 4-epimerase GalE [Phycisphaeraceae bacterium]MCW5755092.1 UDP-glucose 4-epimerase GalE [Phycisphaeraceae bacterium]